MKNKLVIAALLAFAMLGTSVSAEDTTEAATEAVTEAAATEDAAELSDDIYSFEALIDGEHYTFPMTYDEFIGHGWECSDDPEEEFRPYSYTSVTFKKGNLKIYATVMNLGVNTLPLSSCDVAGFSIDSYQFKDAPETTVELPGGIKYGEATEEDITAAYGTPSDSYEGDLYKKLTYSYSTYQDIDLYVYNDTKALQEIDLRNMDESKSATKNAEVVVSDEVPETVLAYTAPTELGDDFSAYIVEYAGDLYKLPAPVSVFLENGWTLADGSEDFVSGRSSGWLYIRKDNQEYHTLVKNYEADATTIENCFVTSVDANVNGTNLPIKVQKEITIGMSKDDMLAALEGTEYEVEDSSDTFAYYKIPDKDSIMDGIEILLNKEKNEVTGIEVSYQPSSLTE